MIPVPFFNTEKPYPPGAVSLEVFPEPLPFLEPPPLIVHTAPATPSPAKLEPPIDVMIRERTRLRPPPPLIIMPLIGARRGAGRPVHLPAMATPSRPRRPPTALYIPPPSPVVAYTRNAAASLIPPRVEAAPPPRPPVYTLTPSPPPVVNRMAPLVLDTLIRSGRSRDV